MNDADETKQEGSSIRQAISLFLIALLSVCVCFAGTIRVPSDYSTIQAGIDAATTGDTVLAADGTYTGSGNRNLDFNGKAIAVMSENGPDDCVIDCENAGRGVYFHQGETGSSVFQGFTVKNGNVGGEPGGGVFCSGASPTIRSCIILNNGSANVGGGIACHDNADATIIDCAVKGNTADFHGGGIHIHNSQPKIINTTVLNNTAGENGGGVYASYSDVKLFNCLLTGNTAEYGGGVFCNAASPTIQNCTVRGNTAAHAGGMACWNDSSPMVTASIFWGDQPAEMFIESGNPVVTYSDVDRETVYPGTGNINLDPEFATGVNGSNYLSHIESGQASTSPCVDAGGSASSGECISFADGAVCMDAVCTQTARVCDDGTVDMGFHYPGQYYTPPAQGNDVPTTTIELEHLWVWDDASGVFTDPGGSVTINTEEPTYLLTHGWDSDLNSSMTAIAAGIRTYAGADANILGWDWSEAANPNGIPEYPDEITDHMLELISSPVLGFSVIGGSVWMDAYVAGLNARIQGGILGLKLSWLLNETGTLGSELNFIGHSHGGGLLAEAANRMYKTFGYQPETLSMLDTPRVLCLPFNGPCLINTVKYVNPAASGETAIYYYTDRMKGGMGNYYPEESVTNISLNSDLGEVLLHSWIHGAGNESGGWYPPGIDSEISFPGADFNSLLESAGFPSGYFSETNQYEFISGSGKGYDIERDSESMEGWDLLYAEGFEDIPGWSGTNVSHCNGLDPMDLGNEAIVLVENGDASFFKGIVFPEGVEIMTFDYFSAVRAAARV